MPLSHVRNIVQLEMSTIICTDFFLREEVDAAFSEAHVGRVSKTSVGFRNQPDASNGDCAHSEGIDPVLRTDSGNQQGASLAPFDSSQGSPSHGCLLHVKSRLTRQGQRASPSHRTASLFRHRVSHILSLHAIASLESTWCHTSMHCDLLPSRQQPEPQNSL